MTYLTDFFKLAADETRLRIILLLAQERLCVCQICGILGLPQPNVSKHLAKLRAMRFVTNERKEKYIYYSLNIKDETIKNLLENIVARKDDYWQVREDAKKLANKEDYLSSCQDELFE